MLELDARDTIELEFWRAAFQSFVTAKSKAEAIEALSGALRSEKEMPHIFRRVLADMLETGGVRGTWYPAWKLAVVLREDVKETKIRLDSWAAYSEVQELIDKDMISTHNPVVETRMTRILFVWPEAGDRGLLGPGARARVIVDTAQARSTSASIEPLAPSP
jgi:hypothetical protein